MDKESKLYHRPVKIVPFDVSVVKPRAEFEKLEELAGHYFVDSYKRKSSRENERIDYSVEGVKELLSKPDLTPDEMANFKIQVYIDGETSKADYMRFSSYEINIEFMLRAAGYKPGKEKELKRYQMLYEEGKGGMVEFWEKAMEEPKKAGGKEK